MRASIAKSGGPDRIGRCPALLVLLTFGFALAGCSSLLDVEAPSRVDAEGLAQPRNAALLVRSVATDFECAFADYLVVGGLVGNELESATTFFYHNEVDRRAFNPVNSLYATTTCLEEQGFGVYQTLSTARWQADNTLKLLRGWTDQEVPERTAKMATVGAYSGYAQLLLGEAMCSVAYDLGPELATAQIFERAVATFAQAIADAQAAGDVTVGRWARAGRARALARLGKFAEALLDANLVPAGFVFNATFSDTPERRRNDPWEETTFFRVLTVDPSYRNLTFDGVADPRVAVTDIGQVGFDGVTPIWSPDKYSSASTPIPIASWEEAQLIIAEAELKAGNLPKAVVIINELHTRAGIPATFASSNPGVILNQIVEERRRELFLESHHLGDIRQYALALIPAPGTPHKSGSIVQAQTCFPLPDIERANNPNL